MSLTVGGQHACPLVVAGYLNRRGDQYGVGPQPYSDRCGTYTDDEVLERSLWMYRLLTAIDRSKKGSLIDKERDILNGMRLRFGNISSI